MIKTKKEKNVVEIQTSIICDICGKEYSYTCPDDIFEIQEFHHIRRFHGYGSIFGDETKLNMDICQHCLKKLMSPYYKGDLNDNNL